MEINKLQKQIHQWAVSKGHWDQLDVIDQVAGYKKMVNGMIMAQKLALVHSEVSEILEADRINKEANIKEYEKWPNNTQEDDNSQWAKNEKQLRYESTIKDTVEAEIVGAIIRLLDIAQWLNMDTEWFIEKEMEYNKLRVYKHGKKY